MNGGIKIFEITIQELLLKKFEKFSNNIAIEMNDVNISYNALNCFSIQLCNDIISNFGKKHFLRIALLFHNPINYIISIIAILRSRNIFVPVDSKYPENKILNTLDSYSFDVILTDYKEIELCKYHDLFKKIRVYYYNFSNETLNMGNLNEYSLDYSINDPIYVYFTSGSTAKPKAILGKNSGLSHFINWEMNQLKIEESFNTIQITSPSFDPYLRDIFLPLCTGGKIVIPKFNFLVNIRWLVESIENSKVNLIHCTPTVFNYIMTYSQMYKCELKRVKYIVLAGEKPNLIYIEYCQSFFPHITLINLYGPTETTLAKCFHIINKKDINNNVIPIGKPIPDVNVYLFNDNKYLSVNNTSECGEIYIETMYATYGYLDNEKLNSEKFIINEKSIIYKTGDLGQYDYDGNLVFRGRLDRQVKINGIRVELDEIENIGLKYVDIIDCAVVYLSNLNKLIMYYTSNNEIDIAHIRNYFTSFLISSIQPEELIRLQIIPLNDNGKKNYKMLTDIDYYKKNNEHPIMRCVT